MLAVFCCYKKDWYEAMQGKKNAVRNAKASLHSLLHSAIFSL
jgi:hypothetical protein